MDSFFAAFETDWHSQWQSPLAQCEAAAHQTLRKYLMSGVRTNGNI